MPEKQADHSESEMYFINGIKRSKIDDSIVVSEQKHNTNITNIK